MTLASGSSGARMLQGVGNEAGALVTPVVLTADEAANIERTLERLSWARRVVVVDSGSTDGTRELARRFPNVVVVERPFDDHAAQWEFGIRCAEVETDWVLALDADYVLTPALVEELSAVDLDGRYRGYRARFRYCIDGKPLRASLYPPVTVLFDRRFARYVQDGHTQRLQLAGEIGELRGQIDHDDRKPLARFVEAQRRYAALEAARLRSTPWSKLSWSGRVRRLGWIAPFVVPLWLLVGRGLLLDGRRGMSYIRQRWIAEKSIARELAARARAGTS